MMLFADPDLVGEDVQRILKLLDEAQKRHYTAHLGWEAQVRQVIGVLQDWFEALEEGTANQRYPSLDCMVDDEVANSLVAVIDGAFEHEITSYGEYWRERKGVEATPEFSRLELHAKRALAEDLRRVLEQSKTEVSG